VAHPGAGDCERLRPGLIAQPVNSATSLAYLAAGADLLTRAGRPEEPATLARLFGGLLVANGLGGVAFHGPGSRSAKWLHDVALAGTLAFIVLHDAAVLVRIPGRHELEATAVAVVGVGAALAARPGGVNHVSAVAGGTAAGLELAVALTAVGRRQRHLRDARLRAAGLLAAATVVGLLSRTGRPLCRPDSLVQGHGLWHVLTAAALRAWAQPLLG
jgi:hypothetical protein